MVKIKWNQYKALLPNWLTYKSFGWYIGFEIILILFCICYSTGVLITIDQGRWSRETGNYALIAIAAILLVSFIYPIIWTIKRKKALKTIKSY